MAATKGKLYNAYQMSIALGKPAGQTVWNGSAASQTFAKQYKHGTENSFREAEGQSCMTVRYIFTLYIILTSKSKTFKVLNTNCQGLSSGSATQHTR